MQSRGCFRDRPVPFHCFGVKRMSCMPQSYQHIDVEEVPHGKSSSAARTSSLVTCTCAGDFVIINPVFEWRISFVFSFGGCSGVRTIESPSILQMRFTPGR